MKCEHARPWKIVGKYETWGEADKHRLRLVKEGSVQGDTVKVNRWGIGGLQFVVKTAKITRSEAVAMIAK